jgi:hypothetical protein
MRFESRDLPPYVEHVPVDQLQPEQVYFIASFLDRDMRVPELKPVVFVGRDLESEGQGKLYFQDFQSFATGVRYGSEGEAEFQCFFAQQSSGVCDYEKALEVLMRCPLRRRS